MKRFIANLKAQAQANPIPTLFAAAAVITATGKLLDAHTAHRNATTWNNEVARRMYMASK